MKRFSIGAGLCAATRVHGPQARVTIVRDQHDPASTTGRGEQRIVEERRVVVNRFPHFSRSDGREKASTAAETIPALSATEVLPKQFIRGNVLGLSRRSRVARICPHMFAAVGDCPGVAQKFFDLGPRAQYNEAFVTLQRVCKKGRYTVVFSFFRVLAKKTERIVTMPR